MPHRHAGEIPHVVRGGSWQRQRHVYGFPFYYIDYGLAMCCALQFWTAAQHDRAAALAAYIALCKRGGDGPFVQLVESAGLRSPFAPGVLGDVAGHAADFLGL
jgi:oligoendopeptidase F